jgi:putative ATP-binding cassette transporter
VLLSVSDRQRFRSLHLAREAEDELFGHFRALTEGIKELKLHRERRGVFLNGAIQTTTEEFQRHNVAGRDPFHPRAQLGSSAVLSAHRPDPVFAAFLGTAQHADHDRLRHDDALSDGAIGRVMGSLAVFGRANAALGKIEELGLSLANRSSDTRTVQRQSAPIEWQRLDLMRVTHSYHRETEGSHFVLGPIDLTFHPRRTGLPRRRQRQRQIDARQDYHRPVPAGDGGDSPRWQTDYQPEPGRLPPALFRGLFRLLPV